MVLTHKKLSTRAPIVFKPDNPKRLHMSKAEVLRENELAKTKAKKLAEAEQKINAELGITADKEELKSDFIPKSQEGQSVEERIAELESLMNTLKGPGSKAKKEALQEEINKLKAQG